MGRKLYRLGLMSTVFLAFGLLLEEDRKDRRDDDLEAADCTDVLQYCPDPSRHEHATAGAEG